MPKRAGRPNVPPSQRRDTILRFVVTKSEAQQIRNKAKTVGLTISEYLRSMAIPTPD
ncbi:MAG: hypothetical protein WCA38_16495 [Candidatus Acidiferrales bacterium]